MLAIHQPYPFYYHVGSLYKFAVTAFVVIFLFLWLFEPFHVNPAEQKISYTLICLIHALTPSLIFYVYFFVYDQIVPDSKTTQWTVAKEIIHLSILFFLFGVASFLVRDLIYTNPDNWSWHFFAEEVKNTFLGGSLISSFLILLNFYRLNTKTQKRAEQLSNNLSTTETLEPERHFIKTHVKTDDFTLHLSDFLFACSEGNYLEIYCKTPTGIKKELKRLTLSQLEMQVGPFHYLIRTHRSYLVNIRHIEHLTGNAQGYWLSFKGIDEKIPVSRSRISVFDKIMR